MNSFRAIGQILLSVTSVSIISTRKNYNRNLSTEKDAIFLQNTIKNILSTEKMFSILLLQYLFVAVSSNMSCLDFKIL